jgi:AcrR family transcriptional regulator
MEYAKKLDRRIRKTREAIISAFQKLSRSKDVGKMTMTEIAEEADIDRKTLYNHYKTVEEIRREKDSKILAQIDEALDGGCRDYALYEPDRIAELISDSLGENAGYILGLLSHEANPEILDGITDRLRERFSAGLRRLAPFNPGELYALSAYYATWIITVYRTWLGTDRKEPFAAYYRDITGKLRTNLGLIGDRRSEDGSILLTFDLKD